MAKATANGRVSTTSFKASSLTLFDTKIQIVAGIPMMEFGSCTGDEERLFDAEALAKSRYNLAIAKMAKKGAAELVANGLKQKVEDEEGNEIEITPDIEKLEVQLFTIMKYFNPANETHAIALGPLLGEYLEEFEDYLNFDKQLVRKAISWFINNRVSQDWLVENKQKLNDSGIKIKPVSAITDPKEKKLATLWQLGENDLYWSYENSYQLPKPVSSEISRFIIWERNMHVEAEPEPPETDEPLAKK